MSFVVKKFDVWNVDWKQDFALGIYIGQQLDLAITLSPQLYARDIEIALTIITTLFGYESQQNSSTLVSAKTKEFAKARKLEKFIAEAA